MTDAYPVRVGEGDAWSGVQDHLCRNVPSSALGHRDSESDPPDYNQLKVGPGHFPCSVVAGPRACQACTSDADCGGTSCDTGFCVLDPADPNLTECRAPCDEDSDCGGGQHCASAGDVELACDSGGGCFCAYPGQGTMKFVTAHEFGHLLQFTLFGGAQNIERYDFLCPLDGDLDTTNDAANCAQYGRTNLNQFGNPLLADPPGMDALCSCQHVAGLNSSHCLQSVETSAAAQAEGFGHYFASRMWNGSGGACLFNYYKEFVDTSCRAAPEACRDVTTLTGEVRVLTEVPVPLDCNQPPKWRNAHGCGVDPLNPTVPNNDFAQSHATEYDWMTFLRGIDNAGIPLADIMSVYNHACQPENEQFDATGAPIAVCAAGQLPVSGCYAPTLRCADDAGFRTSGNQPLLNPRPIYWLDRAITPTSTTATRFDRGGFLDGARRKWGAESDQADDIQTLGLQHGVDENVAP